MNLSVFSNYLDLLFNKIKRIIAGLAHILENQENSWNFKIIENLMETQQESGNSGNFDFSFKLREILNFSEFFFLDVE